MKTTVSRLTLLSVVAALLLLTHPVSSQTEIPITDLGPLVEYGSPRDINNQGEVVGWYSPPGFGAALFLWTPENGWLDLPMVGLTYVYVNDLRLVAATEFVPGGLQAVLWEDGEITPLGHLGGSTSLPRDINEAGQVAGDSSNALGETHAFVWTPEGGMQDLGTLGGGRSSARAMNDLGWVAGYGLTAGGENHAWLWTPTDAMIDLGTLGGNYSGSCDINSLGQVAGSSVTSGGEYHAFLWTAGAGMQDLGTLGGDWSSARAMNDLGWVVGSGRTADSEYHAFLWTPADGMIDLGTLGGSYSEAYDINNVGQVVGRSSTGAGAYHAFLWTAKGGMTDLGTLGGNYSNSVEINEQGQVVGWSDTASTDTASGERHAVIWTTRLAPDDQIRALISDVAGLVDEGLLNKGRGNALIQKLENALRMLDQEKPPTACRQLEAFVNQVEAYTRMGVLPDDVGAELINVANTVIGQLCG